MSARKRAVRPGPAAAGGKGNANPGKAGGAGGGDGGGGTGGDAGKRNRAAAATSPRERPAAPPPGSALAQPVTLGRVLVYLAALLLGALVGIAGSLVQAAWSPGGTLLALAGVGALCYGAAVAAGGRGGGFAAGGGWLLAVMAVGVNRPEGDFVFTGLGPQLFLFGGMLAAVICTTLLPLPARDDAAARLPG
ncbi:DUF6113 family protein [Streptomyces sp. MAR4 CNX-425]|uniref:DUF6113 family protein n=1 Tax=Streptomyces sp. MAR4 CNX-425 TaxID=3406343 RepID=UPI003B50054F